MSTYVRQSAKLKCTMGSAQSALQVSHPTNPVLLCGSPMAAIADIKPMANLAPFGLCKSLANPTVAAATAAASGKLQKMPCVPCVTSPWVNGKMNVSVKGLPALTDGSKCVCMWLGIIKVKSPGQNSVVDMVPPPFMEQRSPAAAATATADAPEAKIKEAKAPETVKKTKTAPPRLRMPQTARSGDITRKKGLLASIATAVTAAVGGLFGKRGKDGDAKTAASPVVTPAETGAAKTPPGAAAKTGTDITARLIRNHFSDKRTFGAFEVFRGDKSIFKCHTCEDTVRGNGNPDTVLKWKINGESAIPYGIYTCDFTYSPRFERKMWAVENVPGFSGIRIHRGKNEAWTEGCLLLGESIIKDYTQLDNSEETVAKFEKLMEEYGNKDFVLEITNESIIEAAKSEVSKNEKSMPKEPQSKKSQPTPPKSNESQPKESKSNASASGKCFCNRDIGVDEFEGILRCLRLADGRKDVSLFTGKNCKIPSKDKTIARLTEEFNMTCKLYGIAHCIQKIHFLSQIYWESDHFNTTLEYASGAGYNPGQHSDAKSMDHTEEGDGPRYKGRGLVQLTWRKNQMRYLKYAKNRFGILKGRTDADIENRVNNFQEIISDTLSGGMDSAGWFWSVGNTIAYKKKADKERFEAILGKTLNAAALYADKYQEGISISVNGGGNGKSERMKYYDELKRIMNVSRCANKSKYQGGLS